MKIRDSVRLTYTKLRTRRIRLIITIFTAALLFSGLATASFVMRGVFASIESFGEEGFGNRYIVNAVLASGNEFYASETIVARAEQIHREMVLKKQAEARRLGIDYISELETEPVFKPETAGQRKMLNFQSFAAREAVREYLAANKDLSLNRLKALSDRYQPSGYYGSRGLGIGGDASSGSLNIIVDGSEKFAQDPENGFSFTENSLDSLPHMWQLMSSKIMEPFILPGSSLDLGSNGEIPIIIPHGAVEELLGLRTLPVTAPADEKLARLRLLREEAADIRFTVCYRSAEDSKLLAKAIDDRKELNRQESNVSDRSELIYDLPKDPCGPVTVHRDVRSQFEKQREAAERELEQLYSDKSETSAILTFQVVGISPDVFDDSPSNVEQIASSVLTSTLGNGWFTPVEITDRHPVVSDLFAEVSAFGFHPELHYVEFDDYISARNFIENENCEPDYYVHHEGQPSPADFENHDPYEECAKDGKFFMLHPFGSSMSLVEARQGFDKIFQIIALVISIIAAIIMVGIVGRVIADSRRETAVFRAIGAKRLHIVQIYVTYVAALSLLVLLCALILGFLASQLFEFLWGDVVTIRAILAYNAADLTRRFHLFAVSGRDLAILSGLVMVSGLISLAFPLLRNIRRNPIRDMRDEN